MPTGLLNRAKTHLPIGLDIGEAGVRLVQLHQTANDLAVHRAAVWERRLALPAGQEEEAPAERISRFVKQSGFSGRCAVTGLSTPDVELHPLDLPAAREQVPDQQLRKAADWEIQRLTTLDKNQLRTAMWALPRSKRAKATYMGTAALRTHVDERLEMCDRAGLICVKVDVAACALANLIWRLRGQPANQVWGVLDLGVCYARLIMCVDDAAVLVRSFRLGGRAWTESIASTLKVSIETAERHKRDLGLSAGAASSASAPAGGLSELMTAILRDDLQRLTLESERSYEYILQCYAPRVPGDLVLVGGGALLKGLAEYLSAKLGIQAYAVSRCPSASTASLVADLADNGSLEVCALACGLSLQGSTPDA